MAKKEKVLKDYSGKELHAKAYELEREIFALRNELAMQRKLEKPHLIRQKRKEKARVLTILSQQNRKEAV